MKEQEGTCPVCLRPVGTCDCPECDECGRQGSFKCYDKGHMDTLHDSVLSFCNHIGIYPLQSALRAIDKHNTESVHLILHDGTQVSYDSKPEVLDKLHDATRIKEVGVTGIAWDGSDWEWGGEAPAGNGWHGLDDLRKDFEEALSIHTADSEEEL